MKPCYWFCSYSTFIATLVVLCVTPFLAVISEIECNSTALASKYHPNWMRLEWYRIKLDWWAVFSINSNSVSYPKKRNDTITWNISYFDCWYFSKSILNSASASWINEQLLNYERTVALAKSMDRVFPRDYQIQTFHRSLRISVQLILEIEYNANKESLLLIRFHPEIIAFGDVIICSLYYYCELRPDETLKIRSLHLDIHLLHRL